MQVRRHLGVVGGQRHFQQPGEPRGGLGVAQVGLQRAEPQGPISVAFEDRSQSRHLDGVSQGGAGAVGLDEAQGARAETRVGDGGADHGLLGAAAGGGESVAATVVVDRRAPHHREDGSAPGDGIAQSLEHDGHHALAAAVAVRARVEGLAPAVGGQCAHGVERRRRLRIEEQVGGSHHRPLDLAAAQRPHGEVHGHQRRAARGVEGQGRAPQSQGIADAARGHRRQGARARPGGQSVAVGAAEVAAGVVGQPQPNEHPGVAAIQTIRSDAGRLEGLPRGEEQQTLCGVHVGGFGGRDPEEVGIEASHIIQEARWAHGPLGVVPAVGGHGAHDLTGLGQQRPQALQTCDRRRKPTPGADDSDRFVLLRMHRARPQAMSV